MQNIVSLPLTETITYYYPVSNFLYQTFSVLFLFLWNTFFPKIHNRLPIYKTFRETTSAFLFSLLNYWPVLNILHNLCTFFKNFALGLQVILQKLPFQTTFQRWLKQRIGMERKATEEIPSTISKKNVISKRKKNQSVRSWH